jgi:hypothetical protein
LLLVNFPDLGNDFGALRTGSVSGLGTLAGSINVRDNGTIFPGLVVGEVVNSALFGLTVTGLNGNVTINSNGDVTQVAGITAIGGAGTPPTAGFLTVDAFSITLNLVAENVTLNNVNQISLASTGGDTIYRDSDGYYVQRATAPNTNFETRG